MPRGYTWAEKQNIRIELKNQAWECMRLYGIRRTTVDELVRRVNIPKGTFYLFYPSKEELLFDSFLEVHDSIQEDMMSELYLIKDNVNIDSVTKVFVDVYRKVDEYQLTEIMAHDDFELLLRKIPDDIVAEHLKADDSFMHQLTEFLPDINEQNMVSLEGAFRALFLLLIHKREIGEDIFDGTVELMIRCLVRELLGK